MDSPKFRLVNGQFGDPVMNYTKEAHLLRKTPPTGPVRCLTPAEVRKNAKQELRDKRMDDGNQLAVLGMSRVQFGQFRGQTFKWLLENALGYSAYISYEVQREARSDAPLYINKMLLKQYMRAFDEGRRAIAMKEAEKKKMTKPNLPAVQTRPTPAPTVARPSQAPGPVATPSKRSAPTPPPQQKRQCTEGNYKTQIFL